MQPLMIRLLWYVMHARSRYVTLLRQQSPSSFHHVYATSANNGRIPVPTAAVKDNLQRETLRKIAGSSSASDVQKELALLRIAYSEDSKLLTGYLKQLLYTNRIFPTHWPAQTSGRWSTWNPPITNWPRACINNTCQATLNNIEYAGDYPGYIEHEWTDSCWSIRDILLPDDDEVLLTFDHDNIEGKIHDLIVNDTEALEAHRQGYDLHTITCCNIFNMHLPPNLYNPHTLCECSLVQADAPSYFQRHTHISRPFINSTLLRCVHCQWRTAYHWQGKDTRQRVLSKNFNHGSKYTRSKFFVRRIHGIEKYGISYDELIKLAERYIKGKSFAWRRKLEIMDNIQRSRIARSLYGFRRIFYDSSDETGREGFSHMISGTVSDYNNMTIIKLEDMLHDDIRLLHNAHDGDKFAIKRTGLPRLEELKAVIERDIEYQGRSLTMTAGIKLYE
jgi:hypothetical protein